MSAVRKCAWPRCEEEANALHPTQMLHYCHDHRLEAEQNHDKVANAHFQARRARDEPATQKRFKKWQQLMRYQAQQPMTQAQQEKEDRKNEQTARILKQIAEELLARPRTSGPTGTEPL